MRATSTPKAKTDIRKTVVLTPDLWEKAKRIFKKRDRTFSSYVRTLVEADK